MVLDISLGGCPSRPVFEIGTSFLLLCLFRFEVLRGFSACLVGVLHYFFDFLFPFLALHISMGPGRSSVLRIGSNSTEASGSGRTGGEVLQFGCGGPPGCPRGTSFPLG